MEMDLDETWWNCSEEAPAAVSEVSGGEINHETTEKQEPYPPWRELDGRMGRRGIFVFFGYNW